MKRKFIGILLVLSLVLSCGLLPMSVSANPDPGAGIAGLWHFDGNANDNSGNGNNGFIFEGYPPTPAPGTYPPGKFNQALNFDGADDWFYCSNTPSLNFNTGAWEAWVMFNKLPSEITTSSVNIMTKTGTGIPQYWMHASGDNSIFVGVRVGGASYAAFSTPNYIQTGQWYHVMGTYDGETLKLYIDDELKATNEGPSGDIDQGTGGLSMGYRPSMYFQGMLDEVRIWDTPCPSYNLNVVPLADTNPVNTSHTVTATLSIDKAGGGTEPAPGVPVGFTFHPISPNVDEGEQFYITDSSGQAEITYPGDGGAGIDSILVWIDQDLSGDFDKNNDVWAGVIKGWVENYVTGGGKINVENGRKAAWSFDGTVRVLPDGGVAGQFQMVDHVNRVSYNLDQFHFLYFLDSSPGASAESPSATHDIAVFVATGVDSDGSPVVLRVTIQDLGEPGVGVDKIRIEEVTLEAPSWPPEPSPGVDLVPEQTIDGGNFQIHDSE